MWAQWIQINIEVSLRCSHQSYSAKISRIYISHLYIHIVYIYQCIFIAIVISFFFYLFPTDMCTEIWSSWLLVCVHLHVSINDVCIYRRDILHFETWWICNDRLPRSRTLSPYMYIHAYLNTYCRIQWIICTMVIWMNTKVEKFQTINLFVKIFIIGKFIQMQYYKWLFN